MRIVESIYIRKQKAFHVREMEITKLLFLNM